jgi:hypothetical protein
MRLESSSHSSRTAGFLLLREVEDEDGMQAVEGTPQAS